LRNPVHGKTNKLTPMKSNLVCGSNERERERDAYNDAKYTAKSSYSPVMFGGSVAPKSDRGDADKVFYGDATEPDRVAIS